MLTKKASGPNAASLKYDILTAIGVCALHRDRHFQKLMMRLIAMITARYSWRLDEVSIGRAELARLWDVDERTVKRELGKLKTLGFLVVKRPGAKGRVTAYSVNFEVLFAETRSVWSQVGSDFEQRMLDHSGGAGQTERESARPATSPDSGRTSIIPFPSSRSGTQSAPPANPNTIEETGACGTSWSRARDLLQRDDHAVFQSWFKVLRAERTKDGVLYLRAPTRFHRQHVEQNHTETLERALRRVAPEIGQVRIVFEPA